MRFSIGGLRAGIEWASSYIQQDVITEAGAETSEICHTERKGGDLPYTATGRNSNLKAVRA